VSAAPPAKRHRLGDKFRLREVRFVLQTPLLQALTASPRAWGFDGEIVLGDSFGDYHFSAKLLGICRTTHVTPPVRHLAFIDEL
jgi:hypothetical protein